MSEIINEYTKDNVVKNINWLFDELWPQMHGRETVRTSCFNNLETIVEKFNKFQTDFDSLLAALNALDGLGLVISTGLIFSIYKNSAVPFDKYTMGYALQNRILLSENISSNSNYSSACKKVVAYVENHPTINSIHDFVLMANGLDPILAMAPK